MRWKGPFRRLEDRLSASDALAPGLYHYQRGGQYDGTRFHLRVEPDGGGILVIDAQKVLHLNPTATEYAKLILDDADEDAAVRRIKSRYRVSTPTALGDYLSLKQTIDTLETEKDVCPIAYLDVERIEPFQTPSSAPYRMDFALTYRCDNDCPHCYVERPRDYPEMDTSSWKKAIDLLWDAGIPHVVFTGGEATMRDDLLELVEYAEDVGLITGLLTNGRRLGKDSLMGRLEAAGLDHVQITLESSDPDIHDRMVGCPGAWKETVEGIKAAVASSVFTITNTTITTINRDTLIDTVDLLARLGLQTIAFNSVIYTGGASEGETGIPEEELPPVLDEVQERAISQGLRLIWYTPTRYCSLDPVALGLGPKQCTAAKYNMCVEPNGDVIPCQSYYQPAGNLLNDPWDRIWNAPLCLDIRDRTSATEECRQCETFSICGGGCPLNGEKGTLVCVESKSSS